MKPSMEIGLEDEGTFVVTADMTPGHLPVVVVSTPSMIRKDNVFFQEPGVNIERTFAARRLFDYHRN